MSDEIEFCPVHSHEGADLLYRWACPDECDQFLAEIDRRIGAVQDGHYFRVITRRHKKRVFMLQEYRNHKPVGKPKPRFARMGVWKSEISRMHSMYRARKR